MIDRETLYGFNNNYWFFTFDQMAALIALDMGCPTLFEKEKNNLRTIYIGYGLNSSNKEIVIDHPAVSKKSKNIIKNTFNITIKETEKKMDVENITESDDVISINILYNAKNKNTDKLYALTFDNNEIKRVIPSIKDIFQKKKTMELELAKENFFVLREQFYKMNNESSIYNFLKDKITLLEKYWKNINTSSKYNNDFVDDDVKKKDYKMMNDFLLSLNTMLKYSYEFETITKYYDPIISNIKNILNRWHSGKLPSQKFAVTEKKKKILEEINLIERIKTMSISNLKLNLNDTFDLENCEKIGKIKFSSNNIKKITILPNRTFNIIYYNESEEDNDAKITSDGSSTTSRKKTNTKSVDSSSTPERSSNSTKITTPKTSARQRSSQLFIKRDEKEKNKKKASSLMANFSEEQILTESNDLGVEELKLVCNMKKLKNNIKETLLWFQNKEDTIFNKTDKFLIPLGFDYEEIYNSSAKATGTRKFGTVDAMKVKGKAVEVSTAREKARKRWKSVLEQIKALKEFEKKQQQSNKGGAILKIGDNKNSRKLRRRKHNTRKLKIGKKLKTTIKYRRKKNDTRRKKIKVNTI